MLIHILVVISLAAISYWWYVVKKVENKLKWLPHVPGWPIIGNAFEIRNPTETLDRLSRYMKKYNGSYVMEITTNKFIVMCDYELIQFILSSTKVLDKGREYKYLARWLGTGLLTAEAEKWKTTRKIITPAFHFSILEQFVPTFETNVKIMVDLLEKEVDKESVDIYRYIKMCTLDIICETAMGVSINAQKNINSDYVFAVKEMCRIIMARTFSAIKRFDVLYPLTADYYKERQYVKTLHNYTNSVIMSRKKDLANKKQNKENENTEGEYVTGVKKKMAFLDLLLQSTIDGKPVSDDVIREEVDTFMFEGHDTTSAAISCTLYCLANHPEVQTKVIEEQKSIFGKDRHRTATYRDLQEMKYLELAIKETLRMYPSVPFYTRSLKKDLEYKNGQVIPKEVTLIIFAYGISRNPKFFKNPDEFIPTRFEEMDGTLPYAYIPFSAGPRNCIGQKFAILEVKSTISKVLRNFEILQTSPRHNLILAAEAVLQPTNGIKIRLRKRNWDC